MVARGKLLWVIGIGSDGSRFGGGFAPRTQLACDAAGIEFIPGTELTAEQDDNELHISGYFIDIGNARFLAEIAKFQTVRQNRIRKWWRGSTR